MVGSSPRVQRVLVHGKATGNADVAGIRFAGLLERPVRRRCRKSFGAVGGDGMSHAQKAWASLARLGRLASAQRLVSSWHDLPWNVAWTMDVIDLVSHHRRFASSQPRSLTGSATSTTLQGTHQLCCVCRFWPSISGRWAPVARRPGHAMPVSVLGRSVQLVAPWA